MNSKDIALLNVIQGTEAEQEAEQEAAEVTRLIDQLRPKDEQRQRLAGLLEYPTEQVAQEANENALRKAADTIIQNLYDE